MNKTLLILGIIQFPISLAYYLIRICSNFIYYMLANVLILNTLLLVTSLIININTFIIALCKDTKFAVKNYLFLSFFNILERVRNETNETKQKW